MNSLLPTKYQIDNLDQLIEIYLQENFKYKKILSKKSAELALKFFKNKKTIDLDEINEYILKNEKLNQNTKRLRMTLIASFLRWINRINQIYINVDYLIKLAVVPSKREEYSWKEIEIIRQTILTKMNNPTFYFFFEILVYNGCRVGELFLIDWQKMKNERGIQIIMALKNGNSRTIVVPDVVRDLLHKNLVNFSVKKQTVLCWFWELSKIIKTTYPDWYKPISSHCFRVNRATYAYMNGMSATEISMMFGSKNFNTFYGTYIKGKTINSMLVEKANQTPIHLLGDFEKEQEIIKLRKICEQQKRYLADLEDKLGIDHAVAVKNERKLLN